MQLSGGAPRARVMLPRASSLTAAAAGEAVETMPPPRPQASFGGVTLRARITVSGPATSTMWMESVFAEGARCIAPFSEHGLHPHRRGGRAGDDDPRPQRHSSERGLGPRRRHRLHRLTGGCRGQAAGPGRITARGALPPESCIDPDQMFGELEGRGVRFDFTSVPGRAGARHSRAKVKRGDGDDEGRGSHRDQGGRVPRRAHAGGRARARRARPRGPDPGRAPARAARSRTTPTPRRARRSCPTPTPSSTSRR